VAYTYNDPTVFIEYAMDIADACHEVGVKSVGVTAGYIYPEPRAEFYSKLDALNVDLKAFTEDFYRTLCSGSLAAVKETLLYLANESDCWFEVTTLLIPGHNDGEAEVRALSEWMVEHLGPEVPLHFSAFHPDFRLRDLPRTPLATLVKARSIALHAGLRHVYTGNVHHQEGDTTSCAACGCTLIARDWFEIKEYSLTPSGCCPRCETPLAGIFAEKAGTQGRRRFSIQVLPD
jgi:pyruvate formate lyase activating enzyme